MSKLLTINRIETWIKSNNEFLNFLMKYEPKVKVVEREEIFRKIPMTDIENLIKVPLEGKIFSKSNI